MEARGLRQRTAGAETARSIWGAASGSAELAWGCGLRRAKGCRKRLGASPQRRWACPHARERTVIAFSGISQTGC